MTDNDIWIEANSLRDRAVYFEKQYPQDLPKLKEAFEMYSFSLELRLPFLGADENRKRIFAEDLGRAEQLKYQIKDLERIKVPAGPKPDTFDYSIGDFRTSDTKKSSVTSSPFITSRYINSVNPTVGKSENHKTSSTSPSVPTTAPTTAPTIVPTTSASSAYENQIQEDMLDYSPGVKWNDISGLSYAKQTLQEAVILPNLRPDLFTGTTFFIDQCFE